MYVEPNHFAVHLKLAQHSIPAILQWKKRKREKKRKEMLISQSRASRSPGGVILSPEDPWQCIHRSVSSTRAPVPSTL